MVFKHDGRRFVQFVTPLGKVFGEFRIVKLFVAFHFRLLDDFIVFINFYPQLDHTRIISLSRLKVKFFTPRFNSADTIAPPFINGIAAVALLLRNDVLDYCHRECSVATLGRVAPSSARYACHLSRFNGRAYPRIGVRLPMQAAPPFIAEIASLLIRRLTLTRLKLSFLSLTQ
jgi:hypothetical protein